MRLTHSPKPTLLHTNIAAAHPHHLSAKTHSTVCHHVKKRTQRNTHCQCLIQGMDGHLCAKTHSTACLNVKKRTQRNTHCQCLIQGMDDYLCAKMHLVDLAGSERAKRTKAEGARMKVRCVCDVSVCTYACMCVCRAQ